VRLSGSVANVMTGEGLDLVINGDLAPRVPQPGEAKPLFDLGVTGFTGRIEGAIDEVHVRDLHVVTTAVKAQLRDIGPITAERLYKDPQGRLGLYDLVVLAGDPARPTLRIGGNVTDVLEFKGIVLKGEVDFLTADLLDLAAEERAGELGHIKGNVAVSDADGSLGIESLSAKISDSTLLSLNIDLVFDDVEEVGEITLATHLEIPRFRAFAAALGSDVEELGAVKFDGNVTGGAQRISAIGTSLVGKTIITGTATGAFGAGKPTLSGKIATSLLHLSDVLKLSSINAIYQANVDEQDVDVMDYSKVWRTMLVDFEIDVAKIAGGGDGASNIKGRVTYLAGVIGLDPLTMTFLGGSASANGKIDTSLAENTFALKGRVNNMRIGSVLREMEVSYPVSGALQAGYDLTGAGNTKAQIPRSLSGSLSITLRNGWLGTSLLDLAGLSLPTWLLRRVPGGNQADLVCAVAPFTFDRGKATSRGLVLETNDVQVVGVGYIDFRQSEVNLQFKPQALHKQFFKIAQPFAVRGPLSHPRLSLTGSPVAGAVTEVLAFPFNLLQTIIQPAANTPGRVPCRIIHTSTAQNGPLGLGLLKKSSPILNPPLLGPILKKPLLGVQPRHR
jgi:AsmA family protein